jgi:signal transduction histidine kinase
MSGSVRDISRRKHAEDELVKHRDNLEELVKERTEELHDAHEELVRKERLATLGQLTATVSHELRNPLAAMRPALYTIEKNSNKDDESMQQSIQRINRGITRCDNIIDELLDFARITDLDFQLVAIDIWLGELLDDQKILKKITVERSFNLSDQKVRIDPERLRRAVINIIENSCQSMLDEEQQLQKNRNSCLTIKTQKNKQRIEIIITDTGTGITDEVLSKIFEPLFSTKAFGVGLGMPTVKQIMEQHDGGIEVDTKVGSGTTMTLWLPEKNISSIN